MKLLVFLFVVITTYRVANAEDKDDNEKEMRDPFGGALGLNLGAGLGLNINPTPYPTVPPGLSQLVSGLLTRNLTTGATPLYNLIRTLTSGLYPFFSNFTYGILNPLNQFINALSSNTYAAICGPPRPNMTSNLLGSSLPFLGPPGPSLGNILSQPNPILQTIFNLFGGSTNPITGSNPVPGGGGLTGTPGSNTPLSLLNSLITALTGGGLTGTPGSNTPSSLLNSLLTALTGGGLTGTPGTISNAQLQSLINALSGILGTIINPSNPTGGQNGNIGNPLNDVNQYLAGAGPFPPNSPVNATFGVSPAQLITTLGELGQTLSSLLICLGKLNLTAYQANINYTTSGLTLLQFLRQLFQQAFAVAPTAAAPVNTLQGLLNNVLDELNPALSPITSILNNLVTSLLGR